MTSEPYIIKGTDLVKRYRSFTALDRVSFSVRQGECFGFLGPNGAGKSTTMRMIYGLSTVDDGELVLMGQSLKLTPPKIKERMGIVPQEDNLDPDLSVTENLTVFGGFFGLTGEEAGQRAKELLSFMGLDEKAHEQVENLSGGLKRRLVIARALINRPSLVILDEPTTGLDPAARHLVWQKLRQLKEEGITLLLTTHYLEEASQLCDRLVIMDAGKILADGSPRELVEKHVPPQVVQVHIPLKDLPVDLEERMRNHGGSLEIIGDGVFLFTNHGEDLWNQLPQWGIDTRMCYLRPSNLEDVFLALTGRRLEL